MKIDIITFHNTSNFGATLQCCALSHYLTMMGCDVEVVNYLPDYVLKKKSVFKRFVKVKTPKQAVHSAVMGTAYALHAAELLGKDRKYELFIDNNLKLTRPYHTFQELANDPPQADLFICGSDQIWNAVLTGGKLDEAFFLRFTRGRKAAYGVSIGELDVKANKNELLLMTEDFERISVRETSTALELTETLGRQVEQVLDCTLLVDKDVYARMGGSADINSEPYLLLYNISESHTSVSIAKREADKRGLKIIDISPNPLIKVNGAKHLINIGPKEFLLLFQHASYVVTNSFHGTAFSVIFEKQFITVPHRVRSTRVMDLLDALQLKNRIAYEYGYEESDIINYAEVRERLAALRSHSYEYLDQLLGHNGRTNKKCETDTVSRKEKTISGPPNLVPQRFLCCGCGACSNICPKNAIQMKTDDEGFLYPEIDDGKCIRCNRCIEVCVYKKELRQYV